LLLELTGYSGEAFAMVEINLLGAAPPGKAQGGSGVQMPGLWDKEEVLKRGICTDLYALTSTR
jgi:hypothetical protein